MHHDFQLTGIHTASTLRAIRQHSHLIAVRYVFQVDVAVDRVVIDRNGFRHIQVEGIPVIDDVLATLTPVVLRVEISLAVQVGSENANHFLSKTVTVFIRTSVNTLNTSLIQIIKSTHSIGMGPTSQSNST